MGPKLSRSPYTSRHKDPLRPNADKQAPIHKKDSGVSYETEGPVYWNCLAPKAIPSMEVGNSDLTIGYMSHWQLP